MQTISPTKELNTLTTKDKRHKNEKVRNATSKFSSWLRGVINYSLQT